MVALRRALLALCFVAPSGLAAQTSADTAAIRQAASDYVEGFYSGDSLLLKRAIRPEFYKYGFFQPSPGQAYRGEPMTWAEALAYAASVRERGRPVPATAPRRVELLDVLDQTAAVKLTASWGTDYLLLAKYDGKWMISHVLWQTPPR